MALSSFAIQAVESLSRSWFVNWVVRGSIHDPAMGGAENHQNWRLFGAMEEYLSRQQVCHAADTLNVYCESILAEILSKHPEVWGEVKTSLGVSTLTKALTKLTSHKPAGSARSALRDGIKCFWSPESDVVCELRNKLIHHDGDDPDFEVKKVIESKRGIWCEVYPTDLPQNVIPIDYDGVRLILDAQAGYWACRHIQNHIHLMDQNLCAHFNLQTRRHRPKRMTWAQLPGRSQFPQLPGTPLPYTPPEPLKTTPPDLPPLGPDYMMVKNTEEIRCAEARYALRNAVHEFVSQYCEDASIAIVGTSGGMPGSVLPHTIRGHDLSLVYELLPADRSRKEPERLEVRLREQNFHIVINISGTNSQMLDFRTDSISEKAAEHLRRCIDKALG